MEEISLKETSKMRALLLVVNDVRSPLQKWAGDSRRYVLNFVTQKKRQPAEMSYVKE